MKHLSKSILFILLMLFCFGCNSTQKEGVTTDETEIGNVDETETSTTPDKDFCSIDKNEATLALNQVADWQINHLNYSTTTNLHDNGVGAWTNATFYLGLLEWAKTKGNDTTYLKWLNGIGEKTNWVIPANFKDYPKYQLYHADEFCIAQTYLGLYDINKDKRLLTSAVERANWVLNNPGNQNMQHTNKQSWTWCDALFMAPPVYVHLAQIENNEKYLRFMDTEFKRTYNYLYSKDDKLFFRDDSYFSKTELNGEKIFWGRGNGWVAAGLVSILKLLPENSEYRPFYENLFKEFVPKLAALQNEDGFWHASLLDPESYPAPETSATALITYALAYGINQGLLDKQTYCPTLNKSWGALLSVIDNDGKLGWVQPIGADPKKVTADMTATYGVGAFLLAGTEVLEIDE
ncbi:MAG: glycoside hydrolase family 105 protein [Flavobacteriaceae bacterium]